ncbi:hypothetical protein VKT23_014540 [Stygiomarasmius scandens]|uniref:Uncharacterized protein n=1 Tax=Marasmiellus scandens TaxID=2682957 RepID=A0ABR1J082_9AGAR
MMDQYGFETWCPDLSESPSSLYNNCHRTVAIDSFTQACAMGGYRRFGVNQEYYSNPLLLAQIYDSYVFGTIKDKSRKEARDPGVLKRRQENNNVGKRRRARASERERYLRHNGYPERVIKAIAGSYCASEDEGPVVDKTTDQCKLHNGKPYYLIRQVPGRNPALTAFICRIDQEIMSRGTSGSLVEPALRKNRGRGIVGTSESKRERIVPNQPIYLEAHYLPGDVPLDFFEPNYFNNLSVIDRAKYSVKPYFAFPPDSTLDWLFQNTDKWAKLSNRDFNNLYGSQQHAYNFPTQEEIDSFLSGNTEEAEQDAEDDRERAEYRARLDADLAARMSAQGKKRAHDDDDEDDDDDGEDLYGEGYEADYDNQNDDDNEEGRHFRPQKKRRRHRDKPRDATDGYEDEDENMEDVNKDENEYYDAMDTDEDHLLKRKE